MSTRRRGFARGDRLGELLREILADELARIDDDRLTFVTITGVEVDRDLAFADVYFSTVDLDAEVEAAAAETLARHRRRLQSAVGRQAHVRRVPALRFHPDEGMRAGAGWRRSCAACATRPARRPNPRRRAPAATLRGGERPGSAPRRLRGDRQGAGMHLPRRGGAGPAPARHPQGGSCRHAGPRRHGCADPRRGTGHAPAPLRHRARQDVPGHGRLRRLPPTRVTPPAPWSTPGTCRT